MGMILTVDNLYELHTWHFAVWPVPPPVRDSASVIACSIAIANTILSIANALFNLNMEVHTPFYHR